MAQCQPLNIARATRAMIAGMIGNRIPLPYHTPSQEATWRLH
jgi:hypothetical protein